MVPGAGFPTCCPLQGQALGLPHTQVTALDLAQPGFKRRSLPLFPSRIMAGGSGKRASCQG